MNEVKKESQSVTADMQPIIYLTDIIKGIKKFWWICISLALVFGMVTFYFSYVRFVPVFKSSATFTVETQREDSSLSGASDFSYYYNKSTASTLSETFPYLLQTNLLQTAIKDDLQIEKLNVSLSASAVKNSNLITLTATGSDAQNVYNVLLSAMKNYPNVAKYAIGNIRLNIITEPQIAERPTNRLTFLKQTALSMVIGGMIGVFWIFVYAFFRKTIRTEENIKSELNKEVLGSVPQVIFKKYNEEVNYSVLTNNPLVDKALEDAICVIRNTLIHSLEEDEKVIMVTSTAPSEGKTTVVANLAMSIASMGKNVLLIDGDIRNPNVEPIFNIKREKKEIKNETDNLIDIQRYDDLNMSILTFNITQRKLWKVMRIEKFKEMVDSLRDKYDYILIDTPPCGLISDASVISRASDTIVYVIQQDMVRVSRIKSGMADVLSGGTKLSGCILNGAAVGSSGYGKYGYGGYGYGRYGYGYGKYGYGYGRYGYGRYGYGYGEEKEKKD